jgi:iron complex outermembrane receptor protein
MTSRHALSLAQVLLAGAAAAAFDTGLAAAQTTSQAAPQAAPAAVGEIIVTAQHRSERLRDVPISITSNTSAQLDRARVTTFEDLNTVAPGVRIDDAGAYVQPSIRGIAATVIGPGTDAPVGIYLDGVFQPNMLANHFDFADLDRIEVDKGPQGTLYGRDATGGAIAVFTKQPSFTPHGDFEVGYGDYDDVVAKAFVTGPLIGDQLAGSLSLFHESHEDYNFNVVTRKHASGLDSTIGRVKLLYQPTDWASFTLIGGYQNRQDTDFSDGEPLNGNTVGRLDPGDIFTTKPHDVALNVQLPDWVRAYYATLNAKIDTGYGALTAITSYQYSWVYSPLDDDRSYDLNGAHDAAYFNVTKDPTFTEDVNFASNKFGPFSFIAGFTYFFDDAKWSPIRVGGPFNSTVFLATQQQPIWAYAGYLEGTAQATDRLTLTAGVRYNWEHRNTSEDEYLPNGAGGFVDFASSKNATPTTFTSVIPRASVRYKLTDSTNVYFTYSQGFKSGGISQPNLFYTSQGAALFGYPPLAGTVYQAGSTYKPETITAYEVGIKSSPTPRITVNAAAFYYDYTNLQVQVDINYAEKLIENAATARVYGLDTDITARVTDELTLSAGVAWTSAHYVSYLKAGAIEPCVGVFGNCAVTVPNAGGNWLPRAPDYTATLTADYKKVFDPGTFDINANLYLSGKLYFDSIQEVSQSAYTTLAAQASWRPAGTHLTFEVWAKNLTNTNYFVSVYEDTQSSGVGYAPPRTFGVSLKYSFDGAITK